MRAINRREQASRFTRQLFITPSAAAACFQTPTLGAPVGGSSWSQESRTCALKSSLGLQGSPNL